MFNLGSTSFIPSALAIVSLLVQGQAIPLEAQTTSREAGKPVWAGVVISLRGSATVTPPAGGTASLTGIDWVAEGSVVATRDASELVIALRDGSRFRLGSLARATVSIQGLSGKTGPIESLKTLAPIPDVAPLVRPVPGQLGAVRIRSAVVKGLYPAAPFTSLADATTLSFEMPAPGSEARVEIEDEAGETVFETRTQAGSMRLPAGILRPGERYYWRVRTVGKAGPAASGSAEFETLAADVARARERLAANGEGDDIVALTLTAEVDHQLGLLREARAGFEKVLSLDPGNTRVSQIAGKLAADEKALAAGP